MAAYSVLIPVYNEADILESKIGELAAYLDRAAPDYEILVCSNGSTDGTEEVGRRIAGGKVRFISIPERGVGGAFRRMVLEAGTQKLVSMDVDLTSDLGYIPECVRLLDDFSVVIGSKRKGAQERRWYRTFISSAFIALVRLLLGLAWEDYSIGTKGWRRSEILGYLDRLDGGSSYVIELTYYLERLEGRKVVEVPVFCSDTRGSKFNLAHEIVYRLLNLLRLWWRVRWA
jgi:glycosyltransferase involved in cell wall biosynthesis